MADRMVAVAIGSSRTQTPKDRPPGWAPLMLLLAALLVPARAGAATLGCAPWQRDTNLVGVDRVPPDRPRAWVQSIQRGASPFRDLQGGLKQRVEDREVGRIEIIVRGHDDRSPEERLGFRVRRVAGELPPRLDLPDDPMGMRLGLLRYWPGMPVGIDQTLLIFWQDWVAHDTLMHPFRFGVVVTCLDGAGNESPPSDTLWIADRGR